MFAVIRVKGSVNVSKNVEDTLEMLNLKSPNHCVVVPETKQNLGMLRKAKDRITWGKIDKKILSKLLEKRSKIPKEELKEMKMKNFDELSDALMNNELKLKLIFRLTPPLHGYKSTKLPYPKGDLGFRGEKINELLERMI
jgi:large subunit ribosomal protein L30